MEPVQPGDFNKIDRVQGPRCSPDGRFVSFVVRRPATDTDYRTTVRIVRTMTGDDVVTVSGHTIVAGPTWNPQSSGEFVFVSRGPDNFRLVHATTDGETSTLLTGIDQIRDVNWAPGGRAIAFTMRATDTEHARGHDINPGEYVREASDPQVVDRLVYRDNSNSLLNGSRRVYLYDLDDGSCRLFSRGPGDCTSTTYDATGTLYWLRKRNRDGDVSREYDIMARDPDETAPEILTTITTLEPELVATSEGQLAYLHRPAERAATRQIEVRTYTRASDSSLTVTDRLDRTIAAREDRPLQWGPDRALYFLTPDEGRVVLRRCDPEAGASATVILEDDLYGFDVTTETIAYIAADWDCPGDIYVRDGNGDRRLTDLNREYLDAHAIQEPEELWFESDDGEQVQGWMLHPPEFDPNQTYPVVTQIHGGPHYMWSNSGRARRWHEFQLLASAGYVVFWCNPRGSTGYGEAHMAAISDDWGGPDAADLLAGVDAVTDRAYIDDGNVFVAGGSYGGYLAAWCLGHSDQFQAAVVGRGGHDRISFYGTSSSAFATSIEDEFDAVPWRDYELLWEHSPAAHVENISAPTLLIHGEEDGLVPIGGSEILYRFLKRLGVETRLVRYPREGHGFPWNGEPAHVVDRYERLLAWFEKHASR